MSSLTTIISMAEGLAALCVTDERSFSISIHDVLKADIPEGYERGSKMFDGTYTYRKKLSKGDITIFGKTVECCDKCGNDLN